ncbi:hypothetical protein [Caldimonas brevitalea]|uniref:Uncharacterized protein n=1 Tax=Caldimonas brevitalea TaxID=413882 RepID=A0A0G3BLE2_9BURK|nr:hypothetical protein [Caldimonas brevitalea]AKJ28216.1 hypothetical protein AAW51_1525 [Caldimonas brevitalea]
MKKTDLEKNKGLKIAGQMKQATIPGRFSSGAGALHDRREQRRLDQARGLVPFAVKLPADLVQQVRGLAESRGTSLNDVVAELMRKGLEDAGDTPA